MKQVHGGYFGDEKQITDFSVNLNPLGMPESVKNAVIAAPESWERYPDPFCTELVKALAEREKIPAERIVCGGGADDLIFRIVHAFRPSKAVIFAPTFGEYARALSENGCSVREHFLHEDMDFLPDETFLDDLTADTDMAFICSPNNPTGQIIPARLLEMTAEKCRRNGIILMCDECFLDFAENAEEHSIKRFMNENTVILKAFTKIYSMAGLRLGYAVCGSAGLAEKIRKNGQYWSVSAPAQTAGLAALKEREYLRETVKLVSRERGFLTEGLRSAGLTVFPSAVNFLLFKCFEGLDDRLLPKGFFVRNCSDYSGLGGGFYRIAVKAHADNSALIEAIRGLANVKG